MNLSRMFVIATTALSFIGFTQGKAQASYLNGNDYAATATKSVIARKTVRVYKVRTGDCEANNRFSFYGYLHKGSRVHRSQWFMSTGGWIIKSPHKYYHNKRTFFLVAKGNWYYKYGL